MGKISLEKSVANFNEKKNSCLEFLQNVMRVRSDFDMSFPELDTGEEDEAQRLCKDKIARIIERLKEQRLKILFAGQFKTGKSTLINAMLGQEVLPADVMPCTAVITEIEYAENPRAVLHFKQNKQARTTGLNPDIAAHLEKYANSEIPPMEIDLQDLASLEDYLTITDYGKEQCEGVREAPIARCVVHWPLEICRNGAVIIDSPGLNEAEARDRTTMGYLGSADMIVHVLNAMQLCGMPDKEFISKVGKFGNLPILFAINRIDLLNNDREREKVRKSALSHSLLQATYGQDGIFFTSAQNALDARVADDSEKLGQSGLPDLEDKIARVFEEDRAKIKLSSIKSVCEDLEIFAERTLPDLQKQLDADLLSLKNDFMARQKEFHDLDNKIDKMQDKVVKCLNSFTKDFEIRSENFFRQFAGAPLEQIAEAADVSSISLLRNKEDTRRVCEELGIAVEEGVQDALLDWLARDGTRIYVRYLQEIGEAINTDLRDFSRQLSNLRQGLSLANLNIRSDALDVNPGIFLDELGNVGMAVGGIGAGLVFVGERFLPALIGGPWGWGLMIAATVGSIIWAAITGNNKARARVKELFVREVRKKLDEEIPAITGFLVKEVTERMRQEIEPLFSVLNKQIADAKRPVEGAISFLEANRNDLGAKKIQLEDFIKKFEALNGEGQKLSENLKISTLECNT